MALAGALILSACTSTNDEPDVAIPLQDDRATTSQAPQPPDTPPSSSVTPPSDEDDPAERCDADQRDALVAAVDGQLGAIVARQWDDALAYATPSFRADINSDDFRRIITSEFPVVAAAAGRDIGRCTAAASGDQATLVVTVQDTDGTQQSLLYLFERAAGRWGINGALPAATGSPAPDQPAITT